MHAMRYTATIHRAIRFSIKTHEVYQKQKRKGKDIPYVTHPLVVGLILSRAGADEEIVAAGILHDTLEDSSPEKPVTRDMLLERFGERVTKLVEAVTERDKTLPWEVRKSEALEHVSHMSHDELLVKSADVISNNAELLDDYARHGDSIFQHFNAPKERLIEHYCAVHEALLSAWPESPLAHDIHEINALIKNIRA